MWGIKPEHDPDTCWGARTIYGESGPYTFGIVRDRMGGKGPKTKLKSLCEWLNSTGFDLLKDQLREQRVQGSDDREVRVEQDGYVLVANPRMSYGYLYIGAWRADSE